MKAKIIIDKEEYDKFIEIEKKLKELDGRFTIGLYSAFHGMTGFHLQEFVIHSDNEVVNEMQKALDESILEAQGERKKLDNANSFFLSTKNKIRWDDIWRQWKRIISDSNTDSDK